MSAQRSVFAAAMDEIRAKVVAGKSDRSNRLGSFDDAQGKLRAAVKRLERLELLD